MSHDEQEICRAGREGLIDRSDDKLAAGARTRGFTIRAEVKCRSFERTAGKFEGDVSSVWWMKTGGPSSSFAT